MSFETTESTESTESTEKAGNAEKEGNADEIRELRMNELTERVIGCAIEVHRNLGPGLLESADEQCFARELNLAGIPFKLQWPVPVLYKGIRLDCGYRVDILVDERLILELKAVDKVNTIHEAQLLTYMKLACIEIGLLMNFNFSLLEDGLKRCRH